MSMVTTDTIPRHYKVNVTLDGVDSQGQKHPGIGLNQHEVFNLKPVIDTNGTLTLFNSCGDVMFSYLENEWVAYAVEKYDPYDW